MDVPVKARLSHSSQIGKLVLLLDSGTSQLELVQIEVALVSIVPALQIFPVGIV